MIPKLPFPNQGYVNNITESQFHELVEIVRDQYPEYKLGNIFSVEEGKYGIGWYSSGYINQIKHTSIVKRYKLEDIVITHFQPLIY